MDRETRSALDDRGVAELNDSALYLLLWLFVPEEPLGRPLE